MRRLFAGALVIVVVFFGLWILQRSTTAESDRSSVSAADQSWDAVERGRYIAVAADCVACHTAPGGPPFAGGLVLKTPFGNIAAPNITPDPATGIGRYGEVEFRRVMREGIGRGDKRLYPAMPYPAYALMSDSDIEDLRAYLFTVAPVKNEVDVNLLPFPFNVRSLLIGWNLINFGKSGALRSDPARGHEWNRGRYLVDALGHCGTCHTSKTIMGADKTSKYLRGGNLQGWYAPNITADALRGVGRWSGDELVDYLKSGANHQSIASGPMAEAIVNSTSKMTDDDLRSIAAYLLAVDGGPPKTDVAITQDDPQMRIGAAVYKDTCAACHGGDGTGARSLFPRLAGNPIVQQDDAASLIRVVVMGSRGVATSPKPTAPAMPALGWRLDDDQVAAVLTYIRNNWGNSAQAVKPAYVRKARTEGP